jgi:hypothetical protein
MMRSITTSRTGDTSNSCARLWRPDAVARHANDGTSARTDVCEPTQVVCAEFLADSYLIIRRLVGGLGGVFETIFTIVPPV